MTNTLLDLCPEFNARTQKWEVQKTDERGNAFSVYSFDSEESALYFIDYWIKYNPKN
jgi:hypothetical protein